MPFHEARERRWAGAGRPWEELGPAARPAAPYRYRRPASQLASHNQGVNSNPSLGGRVQAVNATDLGESREDLVIYQGGVDDRPSDDGPTAAGEAAARQGTVAARGRAAGRLLA